MAISRNHRALGICASVAMLAGCRGAPGGMPQSPAVQALTLHRGSWTATDASTIKKLLYAPDDFTGNVFVYNFDTAEQVGTLSGFDNPQGLCVDKRGDIY